LFSFDGALRPLNRKCYQTNLKTCESCRNEYYSSIRGSKPTISVKSASSYSKQRKMAELAAIIKGISYPSLEAINSFQTKGASEVARARKPRPGPIEREVKLKELGKLVRG
jgi:hypothetical protein